MGMNKNSWNMADNKNSRPPGNRGGDGGPDKPDGDFEWSKIIKSVVSWGLVLVAGVIVLQFFNNDTPRYKQIDFDMYMQLLQDGKIVEAEIVKTDINDYSFQGLTAEPVSLQGEGGYKNVTRFSVTLVEPIIEQQVKLWQEKGVKYTFVKESNEWLTVLLGILPWILIIGVWILFMRRMQSGAGGTRGIFNFGKSKAKMITERSIKVTFKDVAGADEAKVELEEIIEFLREPTKFQ